MRRVHILIAAALLVMLATPSVASAQAPLTIAVLPAITAVKPGDEFELTVQVQSGNADVHSYEIAVQWDPTVLDVAQVTPTQGGCGEATASDEEGRASVSCRTENAAITLKQGETLARLRFQAVSFGTTIIALSESTLTSADGEPIDAASVNAAVNVSQSPATAVPETPSASDGATGDGGGGLPIWAAISVGVVFAVLAGAAGVFLGRRAR